MSRWGRLLRLLGLEPVLVDVGASGAPPAIWRSISAEATYVGFDPDSRELRENTAAGFLRSVVLPYAVVADPEATSTPLYLTRSPWCTSTLRPDNEALADYLFAPLFDVVSTTSAAATPFSRAIESASLGSVDWLKLDTQGTDLRLYQSVPAALRGRMLALDIEPGLIDAYQGEDHFVSAHAALTADGWWLSAARMQGSVRIRRASAARLAEEGIDETAIATSTRTSPGWVEARYLRSITYLEAAGAGERELRLLWLFAMVDGQYGFAFDVLQSLASRFPNISELAVLQAETLKSLRGNAAVAAARRAIAALPSSWRRRAAGVRARLRGGS